MIDGQGTLFGRAVTSFIAFLSQPGGCMSVVHGNFGRHVGHGPTGRHRRITVIQPRATARKLDSKIDARRFNYFTRPFCNAAGIPQCCALHALRTHPAKSAAGLCYPSSQLHMIGRRAARLTPAAAPSATHPKVARSSGRRIGSQSARIAALHFLDRKPFRFAGS